MFRDEHMGVGDWILYYILMVIPVVNIIVILMIMFSGNSNDTLRHMLWANVVMAVVVVVLLFTVFAGFLYNIEDVIREIIQGMS